VDEDLCGLYWSLLYKPRYEWMPRRAGTFVCQQTSVDMRVAGLSYLSILENFLFRKHLTKLS